MNLRWTALLLLIPFLTASAQNQDVDPKVRFARLAKDFKEVQKSPDWKKIKQRRDIIVELGDLDHENSQKILFQAFAEDREQVCRIPAMIGLGKRATYPVLKAMVTRAVRDRNDVYLMTLPLALSHSKDSKIGPWILSHFWVKKGKPIQRAAVIASLGHLKCAEAYGPIEKTLTEETRDVRVLYECLFALARIGGLQAFDTIVPFLESPERFLREGAILALAETGSPAATEKVLPLWRDPFARAQEAVAEAVRRSKDEEGLGTLVQLLRTGRLRVMDTARCALEEITGEKHGLDADAWEKWLKDKAAGKVVPKDPASGPGSVATYYGMRVLSDRLLFVLDFSGSMDAGKPPRIETAREEITKTLDQLNRKTLFNVVGFSGAVMWWKDEEVPATAENIAEAKEYIEKLSVGGGTNVSDTFDETFEKMTHIDTIYFLGDGSPSVGRHTEQEEILARLRWHNRCRKIRIHCIALTRGEVARFGGRKGPGLGRGRSVSGPRYYDEEEAARFMSRIAAEHGGEFLHIEK
ncbi:MAG: HEAT repeat domain-containing protein [Planctomycetota bacterium]